MNYPKYKEGYYWSVNEDIRKHHYWRGFRAACVILVPVVVFLAACAYVLIDKVVQ